MRWRKRIRVDREGLNIAADVDAAIAVNRGEAGSAEEARSVSHVRVVQGPGHTADRMPGADAPESGRTDKRSADE